MNAIGFLTKQIFRSRSYGRCGVFALVILTIAPSIFIAQYRANFPNEVDNFKFYRTGRLTDIKLTISTSADVERILGEKCLKTCDLDENWKVTLIRTVKGSNACTGVGCRTKLTILPEYVGKVWEISLTPKNRVSFSDIQFTEKFKSSPSSPVIWDKNQYIYHWDDDHLSYKIFAEDSVDGKNKKGDLKEISYRVPWNTELPFYSVSTCANPCL